jgi:2-(1,2-epoxy-1,2-dihydrophenyl)acetyl-CoA isomerase
MRCRPAIVASMSGAGTAEPVLVERRGRVAEVVLNRPSRRNALTRAAMSGLTAAFDEIAASDADAVLVRGADGFFCSGLDLDEVDAAEVSIPAWSAVHDALLALEVPVVACVEGGAINAGAALVLACDLIVAGENAYLQIMEAAMGVTPPMNAAWLALRYPPAVGLQLALSCRRFAGPELLRLGIALDVRPDADVLEHARRLAARIAAYPASAGRTTKLTLRRARGEVDGFAESRAAAIGADRAVGEA